MPESTRDYPRVPESTRGYPRLPEITRDYPRLPELLATQVPGKEEFYETLRYFTHKLAALPTISLQLATEADARTLAGYDRVALAAGRGPSRFTTSVLPDGVDG